MEKNTGIKSLLAVVLGLLAGGVLMLSMGFNPIEGYTWLFKGGLMSLKRIGDSIAAATPLILTGLSVAFAFKTGLFNIGAPGQMLAGGFAATAIGLTFDLPTIVIVPIMVIAGILTGSLVAFVPGILKAKFNVNEVVSAIMMNWISFWVVYYGIQDNFTSEYVATESVMLPETATIRAEWISNLFDGSFINLGIIFAIIAVIIIGFILNKTILGYELKAVGFNKFGAEYAGMSVNRNIVISMMIAGGLAGLAGVVQYAGNSTILQIGVMPSEGFDGIAVALLGGNTPIGVLFAALFFGILTIGKGFMTAMTGIPPQIADTIIATIIYFAATSVIMDSVIKKFKMRKNKNKVNEKVVEK